MSMLGDFIGRMEGGEQLKGHEMMGKKKEKSLLNEEPEEVTEADKLAQELQNHFNVLDGNLQTLNLDQLPEEKKMKIKERVGTWDEFQKYRELVDKKLQAYDPSEVERTTKNEATGESVLTVWENVQEMFEQRYRQ